MSERPVNEAGTTDSTSDEPVTTPENPDEINLLDLLIVLAKHKRLVLGLPFAAAIVAVIYSLTLANTYTGTTKILPPQSQSASAGILAQLGDWRDSRVG